MGSPALLPLGYLLAGPLASAVGPRSVLGVGSAIGLILLLAALVSGSVRQLGGGPAGEADRRGRQPSSSRATSA